MYRNDKILEEIEKLEYGKPRIAALQKAVQMADEHKDLPYMLGFRLDICRESTFYGDSLDQLVIFPEVLSLIDQHPDIPITRKWDGIYESGIDRVLHIYKWVLGDCISFYQIPLKDCEKFFQDFKERNMAYGYNLKPYYELMYCFYKYIDETLADYYFQEYEKLETDGNGNCKACNRNFEIQYYLKKGNETKAKQLAKDIENHTLNCGGNGENSAWRQLKITYLIHYLEQGDLKQATGIMEEILKNNQYDKKLTMFNNWHIFLWYYTHIDIGKALQIYKKHWKKWQQEREPYKKFYYFVDNILFFRELKKQRKGEKIKLDLDDTMPIFREDRTYRIVDLLEFYHQQAEELARRFDERNGTCFYQKELEWYLNKEI